MLLLPEENIETNGCLPNTSPPPPVERPAAVGIALLRAPEPLVQLGVAFL